MSYTKGRSIKEWEELIKDYYNSGLDQKDWCDKKGIKLTTFRDRISRMRKEKNPVIRPREGINTEIKEKGGKKPEEIIFMKLTAEEESVLGEESVPEEDSTSEEIEIKIGAFCIKVKSEFDENGFSKVCKVLKGIC